MIKATSFGSKIFTLDTETMVSSLYTVRDITLPFSQWEPLEKTKSVPMPESRLADFERLWEQTGSRVIGEFESIWF